MKKCVKIVPQNEAVGDEFNFTYSGNALTEEQQLTAFLPKPKKAKETKKAPVTTPEGTMDIASTVNSATGETLHPRSALMRVMDELQRHVEQS